MTSGGNYNSMRKCAKLTVSEVVDVFHTDFEHGLTLNDVSTLRKVHGFNKLPEEKKVSMINTSWTK
jgi:hypothetical protein